MSEAKLTYEQAMALLDEAGERCLRVLFNANPGDGDSIDAAWANRDRAWEAIVASRPVTEHIADLLSAQRGMSSSLNLGRMKFHELEDRIAKLENSQLPKS
jgi:hypothetical protein